MAMELKQQLKLTQQLVMTPQLQQAIKLLQLSRMELLEQVREEMEQNPLLEQPDEQEDLSDKAPGEASLEAANAEPATNAEAPVPEKAVELKVDGEGPPEIDWEAYFNSYQFNEQSTTSNRGSLPTGDQPSFEANLVRRVDLFQHLSEQFGLLRLNDAERRIGLLILGNLDDGGYLKLQDVEGDPLIRLVTEADVSLCVAEKTLRRIQHLDPKGCGARDLQECLLIQAAALNEPGAALLGVMIKKYMKHLESKNLPAIAKDLRINLEEVVEASKLRISGLYRNALRNGSVGPGQAKEFIQEKLRSAMWLIRSIHQRQRTIYKVTESIVKFQREFFDKGIAFLRPLILREVAEDIGMHESTVSRVTTNKYVHTPQGIFELKYFFNSSIARVSGDEIASEAVKNHIKQLVSAEDASSPYSDQKIVELLRSQGIEIARRTVAKYREVLGVLPSSKRKRYY